MISKYESLLDENIKVICNDGQVAIGEWTDWTSAADNEPDPESIILETSNSDLIEIFVSDIKQIEKCK